ncbi:hypothetical protein J6590_045841 [Homalodisca vitripennis]|nr:hypothetical protein J6590_045841 [Homalodisca vitripennis]
MAPLLTILMKIHHENLSNQINPLGRPISFQAVIVMRIMMRLAKVMLEIGEGKAIGRPRGVRVANNCVPDIPVEKVDDWNEIEEGNDMSYLPQDSTGAAK